MCLLPKLSSSISALILCIDTEHYFHLLIASRILFPFKHTLMLSWILCSLISDLQTLLTTVSTTISVIVSHHFVLIHNLYYFYHLIVQYLLTSSLLVFVKTQYSPCLSYSVQGFSIFSTLHRGPPN